MLRRSPARVVAFQLLPLIYTRRFSEASRNFRRELRGGNGPIRPELLERVSRLLVLGRYDALHDLSLDFSDELLNSLLRRLRLNPEPCLEFFNLASKQQKFRPDYKAYCKMVHILARARLYDQTKSYVCELVALNHSSVVVWAELVRVFKEFLFSPTVFDTILKVYAEKGMIKNALHVFDNMGNYGRIPSLLSCNSLLSNLVKKELPNLNKGVQYLADRSKAFLVKRFKDITNTCYRSEVMNLTLAGFEALLSSDDIQVPSEGKLYDFMMEWAEKQYPSVEKRKEIIGSRLGLSIRFPFLSLSKLKSILASGVFEGEVTSDLVQKAILLKEAHPQIQRSMAAEQAASGDCSFTERDYEYKPVRCIN